MPEPTPEAWAQIRFAYEHTDQPLAHICAEHDITEPMLRYRVKRWDWTPRRRPVPGEGPQAVEAPQRTFYSPSPVRAANGGEGLGVGGCSASHIAEEHPSTPPAFACASADDPPHRHSASKTRVNALMAGGGLEQAAVEDNDPALMVPRLQSAVARVLAAIEATTARLAAGPRHPRDIEQSARALSALTRTLRELNALLAQQPAPDDAGDDPVPKDMNEFRFELARRIRGFIEARQAAKSAEASAEKT